MKLVNAVLVVLIAMGVALACSGCTFRIENIGRNVTSQASVQQLNLPEYPNGTRTSYSNVPLVGQIITYQTNDTPTQVLEFYKSHMEERGYKVSRSFTSANETGGLVIFTKAQDSVWVTVGQSNATTNIAVRTSFH